MRRTRLSRFLTAMFGIWFTFSLVQPTGMAGMSMSSGSASMSGMNMSSGDASTSDMSASDMSASDMSASDMWASHMVMASMSGMDMSKMDMSSASRAEPGSRDQSSAPEQCDQHDCCCSAVSLTMLSPEATLAWLPEHVINQDTPQGGDCVVHTDGQILLPFANGPPATVSA